MEGTEIFEKRFRFVGARPVRAEDLGDERAFLGLWEESNAHSEVGVYRNMPLREIGLLAGVTDLDGRDEYVTTSIIQWLGTKVGACFLDRANRLARDLGIEQAYVKQWQREMLVAQRALNSGFRGIDLVLNSKVVAKEVIDKSEVAPVSERDLLIAMATIQWLATDQGQELIAEAEWRIEVRERRDHDQFGRYWNQPASVFFGHQESAQPC